MLPFISSTKGTFVEEVLHLICKRGLIMNKQKVRFVILRETEKDNLFNDVNEENFNKLDLGFEWREFEEQVKFLVRENYITRPLFADDTIYIYNSILTEKGENYLESNQWYKKAYRTAKEIKEWIK
jgi:YjcQ protein